MRDRKRKKTQFGLKLAAAVQDGTFLLETNQWHCHYGFCLRNRLNLTWYSVAPNAIFSCCCCLVVCSGSWSPPQLLISSAICFVNKNIVNIKYQNWSTKVKLKTDKRLTPSRHNKCVTWCETTWVIMTRVYAFFFSFKACWWSQCSWRVHELLEMILGHCCGFVYSRSA